MFKLKFFKTPYNSIRVWMEFNWGITEKIMLTKEYQLFQNLSIWGGYDKREDGLFSWELSLTLTDWIKERFGHYCTIEL
jgi:hypothetical protein